MLGVTRKIDELGRVVIPIEFRKSMGIEPGDPVEVFAENGRVILSLPCKREAVRRLWIRRIYVYLRKICRV